MKHQLRLIQLSLCFLVFTQFPAVVALAQEDDSIDEMEAILDKESDKEEENVSPVEQEKINLNELSALKNLQAFSDIAVIQRKYLPKTKRMEAFGGLGTTVNNAFFLNFGLMARMAFHFSESIGIEGIFMWLTNSKRQATDDLYKSHGIGTDGLVSPEQYYGADVVWTPIYGKMSLFESSIVPFDLYFAAGFGMTQTNQNKGEPTFHIGTGQKFAMSKSMAFRWDFSWNFYSADYVDKGQQLNGNFDNLYLTLGFSFFFPEAEYR